MISEPIGLFYNLSSRVGKNFSLVQGAGGNSSIKEWDALLIKSSGHKLKDALKKDIFVKLNLKCVLQQFETSHENLSTCVEKDTNTFRPSIETFLHAVIPYKFVFHIHSLNAIAVTVQDHEIQGLDKRLRGLDWDIIGYKKPGIILAKEVASFFLNKKPAVVLLKNHGAIVASDTLENLEDLIADLEKRLYLPERNIKRIPKNLSEEVSGYRVPTFREIHQLALDDISFALSSKVLYPDYAVFLTYPAFVCDNLQELEHKIEKYFDLYNATPSHLIIKNMGVLVRKNLAIEAEEMLKAAAIICSKIASIKNVSSLSEDEIEELRSWDAEKYRQQLLPRVR